MLKPVLLRANYKVTTSLSVTLESLLGSNLPLLFPEVIVMNRTATSGSLATSGVRSFLFTSQSDPDFDGAVATTLFTTFALGNGSKVKLTGLPNQLDPAAYGITTALTFINSGPAATELLSIILTGLVESSVTPDPLTIVNAAQEARDLALVLSTPDATELLVRVVLTGAVSLTVDTEAGQPMQIVLEPSTREAERVYNLLDFAPLSAWRLSETLKTAVAQGWLYVDVADSVKSSRGRAASTATKKESDFVVTRPDTAAPGDVMVCNHLGNWVALPPGPPGTVLLSAGPGALPVWGDDQSGIPPPAGARNGDILLYVARSDSWSRLASGPKGHVLQSMGHGQVPRWVPAPMQSTVTMAVNAPVGQEEVTIGGFAMDLSEYGAVEFQTLATLSGPGDSPLRGEITLWNATDNVAVAQHLYGGSDVAKALKTTIPNSKGHKVFVIKAEVIAGDDAARLDTLWAGFILSAVGKD